MLVFGGSRLTHTVYLLSSGNIKLWAFLNLKCVWVIRHFCGVYLFMALLIPWYGYIYFRFLPAVPPALISLNSAPPSSIEDSRIGVHVFQGRPISFSCSVGSPSAPLNYTWFHNNVTVPVPLTQSVLTVNTTSLAAAGVYRCVVSNDRVQPSGPNFTLPTSAEAEEAVFITSTFTILVGLFST